MCQYRGSYWLIKEKKSLALVKGINKSLYLIATDQNPVRNNKIKVTNLNICLVNKFNYLDNSYLVYQKGLFKWMPD